MCSRYVMVSAINADHPENAPEEMRPYYDAKAEADRRLEESGLDYTIVRPGLLTNDEGTGLVEAGPRCSARRSRATTSPRCWRRC